MTSLLKNSLKILVSWRFLLNLVIILVLTCWIPLVSQTMVMRDNNGNIIQERTDTARLYQSWYGVLTLKPNLHTHLQAVLWHFGICFAMSYVVWWITLRSWTQQGSRDPAEAEREEEEPDSDS